MKTILTKFHLNITTYLFFLLSFLCGYFKQTLMIFLIVFLHECGHIIMIKLCNYKFLKVEFYPFGGMTKIDKPLNSSINKEILIASFGVFIQLLIGVILTILNQYKIFQWEEYSLFQNYNLIILLFNLLPIIPLDGSVILHACLEKFFSYKLSFRLYEIISCVFFLIFLFLNLRYHMDNYFICGVLLTEFFLLKKQEKYIFHRFYLERYLHEYPYKKIKNTRNRDIGSIKKETLHFFYEKNRYLSEKEVLQEYLLKK